MDRTVDLCIITEHYHPVYSGAAERFRRYLPGLRRRGIEARVFTVRREGLAARETVDGTPVLRFPAPVSGLPPSAELMKRTLRHFKDAGEWPDIAHVITHTLRGAPYLWELRRHGSACVNSITMYPEKTGIPPLMRARIRVHQRLRYGLFNRIIAGSREIAAAAGRSGIPLCRIRVIANGVDTNRFCPVDAGQKTRLRKSLGLAGSGPIVLFAGGLSARKGADLLLEAWPLVRRARSNARLVLIGPDDRQKKLNASFPETQNGLSPGGVIRLGPVVNIEQYMQIADLLVLPSRLEGIPNVVMEGMACGLPCVLTPFTGLPADFGEPGTDFILTSFDPKRLAGDIVSLLGAPERRKKIGAAGRRRAAGMWSLEKTLDAYAELYRLEAGRSIRFGRRP